MEIYRYRRFERGLDELDQGYLWFSHPKDLNDLFDCNPQYSDVGCIEDAWLALAEQDERFRDNPVGVMAQIVEDWPNSSESLGRVSQMLRDEMDMTVDQMGVCCFGDSFNNLLMWSHYTDSSKGLCIKYDSNVESCLAKVRPVQYVSERKHVSLASLGDAASMEAVAFTKSSIWAYEKEWRTNGGPILPGYSRKLPINPGCVKAIYCGPNMIDCDFVKILDVCVRKYPQAELYRGRADQVAFRFIFERSPAVPGG